jgi:hypothetical protein
MPRNRIIFYIVFIVFVLGVILIAVDMGSRTTAPWKERKKNPFKKYEIDHKKRNL